MCAAVSVCVFDLYWSLLIHIASSDKILRCLYVGWQNTAIRFVGNVILRLLRLGDAMARLPHSYVDILRPFWQRSCDMSSASQRDSSTGQENTNVVYSVFSLFSSVVVCVFNLYRHLSIQLQWIKWWCNLAVFSFLVTESWDLLCWQCYIEIITFWWWDPEIAWYRWQAIQICFVHGLMGIVDF